MRFTKFSAAALALCAGAALAQPSIFTFDGNLDARAGSPGVLSWFGGNVYGDFGTDTIGGVSTGVLNLRAGAPVSEALQLDHGYAANGGGSYLNVYTLILDIKSPAVDPVTGSGWMSFMQTSNSNGNDGDCFRNPAGGIGIAGDYEGNLTADVWHRVAIVVDLTQPAATRMSKYIDGTLVGTTSLSGVDGRYAAYCTGQPSSPYILLMCDNDGDTIASSISSIYFDSRALSAGEIAALGAPTAAGIIPPPSTPPTVAASIAPRTGNAGATVLVTGAVTSGTNPNSSSYLVTADLSAFGLGSAIAMNDSGLNGDAVANDGIYSARVTLPSNTAPGLGTATLTVKDNLNRSGSSNVTFYVNDPVAGTHGTQIDFDNGTLASSFGPGVLEYWDKTIPGETESFTHFGTTSSFSIPAIGGTDAQVMKVGAYTGDEGLRYNNLSPGNGGGDYVNEYTVIWDILIPSSGEQYGRFPFWNTSNTNANASDMDADLSTMALGFYRGSIFTTADNAIQYDRWYRVAFSVNTALGSDNGRIYIDGALAYDGPIDDSTDVGYSLYSTTDGDPAPDLQGYSHMCTSSNGLSAEAYINSFYFVDRVMSPTEMAALGGATAGGIFAHGPVCPACAADFNNDGGVDGGDIEAFFNAWEGGAACGDVNQDGGVDGGDIEAFFHVWENGGC